MGPIQVVKLKFQFEANKIIDNIYKNKKIPIIVGGSNLYVDALIKKTTYLLVMLVQINMKI